MLGEVELLNLGLNELGEEEGASVVLGVEPEVEQEEDELEGLAEWAGGYLLRKGRKQVRRRRKAQKAQQWLQRAVSLLSAVSASQVSLRGMKVVRVKQIRHDSIVLNYILSLFMNPEPSYLDIDDELYPDAPSHSSQSYPSNNNYQPGNQSEMDSLDKQRRRRTVRDMLVVVDLFRKWQLENRGSIQQFADNACISRRTLEYYLHSVKQGERFGFPFQEKLEVKLSEFQRFLKEKSMVKKAEELAMLAKLKNYYK